MSTPVSKKLAELQNLVPQAQQIAVNAQNNLIALNGAITILQQLLSEEGPQEASAKPEKKKLEVVK